MALVIKNPPANAGDIRDVGSLPGLERSPGEGNGHPLQYSCLENFMDRGAWPATVHGVAKHWTQLKQLSMHTHTFHKPYLMAKPVISGLGNIDVHVTKDIKSSRVFKVVVALPFYALVALSLNFHGHVAWVSKKSLSFDQIRSVAESCPTLCDPMNPSTPRLPVHHQLPEFTQTHVHRVSDTIQPSHPLSSPSPPAPNPFQHQSLFQ